MENREQKSIYFIGVGGIGMSALARFFKHEGYLVGGYDRVESPLTLALESEGILVHYEDNVELIDSRFKDSGQTKVVYTPAIPKTHSELNWFQDNGFEVVKRSRALGVLCSEKYTMAVAGTHGKSSTSTLVAWLNHLASTDGNGSAFLGAISKNFGTNCVMGNGDRMAVEADEFDRSFHQLHPQVALITAADPDHLDIYGTKEAFKEAFEKFASQCSQAVVVKLGLDLKIPQGIRHYTYSLDDSRADYYAQNLTLLEGGYYSYDIVTPHRVIEGCRLGVPGRLNVENSIGAVALLDQKGFDEEGLKRGLQEFEGIERRFDFWINESKAVYMDDYAHHPEELSKMLDSVRAMFPNRHITICFQPHLFSRTADFAEGFARSLSLADSVVMLPIYPAREEPMEGVTSDLILKDITVEKCMVEKSELVDKLQSMPLDIVITAGAGDIDRLRADVAEVVKKNIRTPQK